MSNLRAKAPATLQDVVDAIESLNREFERLSATLEKARPAASTWTYTGPAEVPSPLHEHKWEEVRDEADNVCWRCIIPVAKDCAHEWGNWLEAAHSPFAPPGHSYRLCRLCGIVGP